MTILQAGAEMQPCVAEHCAFEYFLSITFFHRMTLGTNSSYIYELW